MIAVGSTSYPTLAVIDEFGITDPEERRMIWQWSDHCAAGIWNRKPSDSREQSNDLLKRLQATFSVERLGAIQDRLFDNLRAARQWCLENME